MNLMRVARTVGVVCLAGLLLAACGGGARSYGHGEKAARNGDWDSAVAFYRRAVEKSPNRSDYRIGLERAMINASSVHMDQARVFEARAQLDEALREYRRASEFNPTSRVIGSKVQEIERRVRDQLEAAQPKTSIQQMRERARQEGTPPLLNLTMKLPVIRFANASVRDILNFVGSSTSLNVTYDRDFQDRAYTVQLDNITLEDALNQILSANQYFYKVVNDHTITIVPDTPQKRAQYEEQVIRTFYVSHADATELAQLLTTMIRLPNMAVQPRIVANKTANTITVGATANVAAIIEKIIESNDNPRAEVVVDVQILEINRSRAKQFGLDLSTYAIGGVFSPEADIRSTGNAGAGAGAGAGAAAGGSTSPQSFNLNSISRGINTGDFYLSVPSAVMRFLENDTETKLIAKPQLRGAEGQKITLNLGDDIPVPSTVFTPFAQGGANINPLTSFNYKTVGVVVEMTPRVTFEDDIILELTVESSSLGPSITIGGQSLPSFGTRKVQTKLRLRDGESNLLAGLLREDERKSLKGFPAILRLPILKQLFSSNDNEVKQTDIVMLLTPRLVRTHELTQQDVSPIFIGTQQNLGLGGPPPLIAPVEAAPANVPASAPASPVAPTGVPPAPVIPPGSSTVPGTTTPQGTSPQALRLPQAPPSVVQPQPNAAATQVLLTSPSPELRVGGGPYTVPISVSNASRLSALSITVTFNPAVMRVRTVQEGSFMRQGGNAAQFTQQVDGAAGRIDLAVTRTQDQAGASGAGLVAAVLFDVIGPGQANFSLSGSATVPGGGAAGLQFAPSPVSAR
jgi:general secretion pathway protein D